MAEFQIIVNTTGAAGFATGTGKTASPVRGLVYAVKLDYNGAAPASTIAELTETGGLGQMLVSIEGSSTDQTIYPRVPETTNNGTALGSHTHYYIDGHYLTLSVSDCNALSNVLIATIQVIE